MMFKSYIKLYVLKELCRGSRSGYDLMLSIGKIGGKKPSAGYIYPLLGELSKKGFVRLQVNGRRKLYGLTGKGKKLLLDLRKHHERALEGMVQTLNPISDKKELKDYVAFKTEMELHKDCLLRNIDLFERFHRAIFRLYNAKDSRLRRILKECVLRLEDLK